MIWDICVQNQYCVKDYITYVAVPGHKCPYLRNKFPENLVAEMLITANVFELFVGEYNGVTM